MIVMFFAVIAEFLMNIHNFIRIIGHLIGFDACTRATYENANNIYGFAKYMVASEENESGYGWYYSD